MHEVGGLGRRAFRLAPMSRLVAGGGQLVGNAGSLVGTTVATSLLGAVFWWLAARHFDRSAVGLAGAAISATMLISMIANSGIETLLIGEVARDPDAARSLVGSAAVIVGAGAAALGLLFGVVAAHVSPELRPLGGMPVDLVLFAAGSTSIAVSGLFDAALVGRLRGGLQLLRNLLFGVVKLGVLPAVAFSVARSSGMSIYGAFVVGDAVSSMVLVAFVVSRSGRLGSYRPCMALLARLWRRALAHHLLAIGLRVPPLVLPLIVVTALSASTNAVFFVAFMVASVLFAFPGSLTTMLYAVGAAEPQALVRRLRLTLVLAAGAVVAANVVLFAAASIVLRIFGDDYARQGTETLRILALTAFPLIVKNHFTALSRIYDRVVRGAALIWAGTGLELVLAVAGAYIGGLDGLAVGWSIAVWMEALAMTPMVYRVASGGAAAPALAGAVVARGAGDGGRT